MSRTHYSILLYSFNTLLISIESELKRTRLAMIIYNKYLKIIGLISLKLIPIKGYKFLSTFS
jgi:hypothetical protein